MTRLEFYRRAKGLSQEGLGNKILYSRSVISRLESENPASEDVHPRLRAALERFFGEKLETLLSHIDIPDSGTKSLPETLEQRQHEYGNEATQDRRSCKFGIGSESGSHVTRGQQRG